MLRRAIGVKEHDGSSFDTDRFQPPDHIPRDNLVQRCLLAAIREHPFRHLEYQVPWDERPVLAEEQIERLGSVNTPDLVHVAEAAGRDESCLCAFPLEYRV